MSALNGDCIKSCSSITILYHNLVPASGVLLVICILNGPGPIAVDAATIQRYVVYGVNPVTLADSDSDRSCSCSPLSTPVIFIV